MRANLSEKRNKLREGFSQGKLSRYEYLSKVHEFNKLLLAYSEILKSSHIDKISLEAEGVKFSLPEGIQMYTDGGARTAPFEMFNFNTYEAQDEAICIKTAKSGGAIIDVGANIGWFSILMSKKVPRAKIYSFEPIIQSYEFLIKNLKINNCENVKTFNLGFSDHSGKEDFFILKVVLQLLQ